MSKAISDVLATSVFILGGGATGLFASVELAEAGLSVVLAEKKSRLASGPSTTNEGMLHRGTYHAAAIRDRAHALDVARRCAAGYARILKIAPEAVEDTFDRSFIVLTDSADVDEICSRWDEAAIPYAPVSKNQYRSIEPGVNLSSVASIFEVQDKSVNPRAIYRNLLRRAEQLGVRIFTDAVVDHIRAEDNLLYLRVSGRTDLLPVLAGVYVCTAGSGIKEFFSRTLQTEVPMQFWKSHLLDTPRVSRHNLFLVNPGEFTLMHHGAWSIAGLNADAVQVPEPVAEPAAAAIKPFERGLRQLFPHFDSESSIVRVCIKVDVGRALDGSDGRAGKLKLSYAHGEPVEGHIWVIPGKMTEVPCVARALVDLLRERLSGDRIQPPEVQIRSELDRNGDVIANRPIDDYGPPRYMTWAKNPTRIA